MMGELVDRVARTLQAQIMREKARCFQRVFDLDGPNGHEVGRVLASLKKLGRANATTFDPDPQVAAFRAGKREMWLHIQYFLNLSDAQVQRLVEVESDYVE